MSEGVGLERLQIDPMAAPGPQATSANRAGLELLSGYFQQERWDDILRTSQEFVVKAVEGLPRMYLYDSTAQFLYFSAQAYRGREDVNRYAACLKLLYSLEPHAGGFGREAGRLISEGAREYVALAGRIGAEKLNRLQVGPLFAPGELPQVASGCAILLLALASVAAVGGFVAGVIAFV